MNNRLKRFNRLSKLAQLRERDMLSRLGHAQSVVQANGKRLNDLIDYQKAYQQQVLALSEQGMSSHLWRHYQEFLSHLDTIIVHQRQLFRQSDDDLKKQRDTWHAAHNQSKILGNIEEQYREFVRKQDEKKDQKILDENSQMIIKSDKLI